MKIKTLHSLSVYVEEIFKNQDASLSNVKWLAAEVSQAIEVIDPFIQLHTEAVCPSCREVCCINRHSYYESDDIIYIFARGGEMPYHKAGVDDSDPCQFLGGSGCTIKRTLRPYRCNWYFCAPLLDHIRNGPISNYRKFIDSLEMLTRKRTKLLEEFDEIAGKI